MKRFLFVAVLVSAACLMAARGGEETGWFARLTVGKPIQQGNLTIFPVFASGGAPDTSRFLTLDEGLAKGVVKVGELGELRGAGRMMRPQPGSGEPRPITPGDARYRPLPPPQTYGGGARVNQLAILNTSDRPLILLAGEIVSGGKQDRVVGRDRIVPPNSEPLPLDVFCVEPGRWHGLSGEFASAKTMAHPSLRQEVTETRDQQRVWNEVAQSRQTVAAALTAPAQVADRMAAEPGAAPPARTPGGAYGGVVGGVVGGVASAIGDSTTSYARTMQAKPVQDHLGQMERELLQRLPGNAVGVVVAVGGRVAWADVFTSPALFARYRDKLLQSYSVEATRTAGGLKPAPTEADAADFLRPLVGRQTSESDPGIYRLTRTEASGTVTYELQALDAKAIDLHLARMAR